MKKKFDCEVDCANCALKMEEAIRKIDGVEDADVNFIRKKLTVDAAADRFEAIMDEVVRVCKKVEPDCEIKR